MQYKPWDMPRKILAFDSETSGIGEKYGLQQWSAVAYNNSKKIGSIDLKIKIFETDLIDPKALEVHGLDPTEGLEPREAHKQMVAWLGKFVDKFKKEDKFYPLAYNGGFDIDRTIEFCKKCDDPYFGSWQNFNVIDPLAYARLFRYLGFIDLPNLKLGTLCEYYGIPLKAHDAESDIEAAVKLAGMFIQAIKTGDFDPIKTKSE